MKRKATFLFLFLLIPFVGLSQQILGGVIAINVSSNAITLAGDLKMADGTIIVPSLNEGLTASETQTQAGALQLTAQNNQITVAANVGDAVKLFSASKGLEQTVINDTDKMIRVFPGSDDEVNSKGVNLSDEIKSGASVRYVSVDGVEWRIAGSSVTSIQTFGAEFEIFQSLGQSNTASSTLVNKLDATTTSKPVGTYRIGFYASLSNSNGNQDWRVAFSVAGALVHSYDDGENRYQAAPSGSNNWSSQCFVFYLILASPATIDLDMDFAAGGSTARIADATIEIWRVL